MRVSCNRNLHRNNSDPSLFLGDGDFKIFFSYFWAKISIFVVTKMSKDTPRLYCIYLWTVRQLSIMIIYNGSWSKLFQWISLYIVRWQTDLVNTKESLLPVCDKPYHKFKKSSTALGGALCDRTHSMVI